MTSKYPRSVRICEPETINYETLPKKRPPISLSTASTLTSEYKDIPRLSTIPQQSKIKSLKIDVGSSEFAIWYIISTYLPIFTSCVCPLTDMMSIASLVSKWRIDAEGLEIEPEMTVVLVLNAISLAFGAIGNVSVLLNFSKKMNYKISQLISIIGFAIAGILLFSAIMIAENRYFNDPTRKSFRSEGFWFAIMTTILHWICCLTCLIHYLGFLFKKYPADFNIYTSERGIIVYTTGLAVVLSVGAAISSKLMDMRFGQGQYFTVITITTVGYGNIVPITQGARAFTMVFALIGVINLGLIVTMISSMTTATSSATALSWNHLEINRIKILSQIMKQKTIRLTRKDSFELMRILKIKARIFQRVISSLVAFISYLIFWLVGALIFHLTEKWDYFDACYFVFVSLLTIGYGDYYPSSPPGIAFFVVWALGAVPLMTCLISNLGDLIYNMAIASVKNKNVEMLFNRIRADIEDDIHGVVDRSEKNIVTIGSNENNNEIQSKSLSILKQLQIATLDSKQDEEKTYSFEHWTKILQLLELTNEEEISKPGIDNINHELFWLSDSSPLRFPIKEPNYISFLLFSKLESNMLILEESSSN